jgi:hypothetical protein
MKYRLYEIWNWTKTAAFFCVFVPCAFALGFNLYRLVVNAIAEEAPGTANVDDAAQESPAGGNS